MGKQRDSLVGDKKGEAASKMEMKAELGQHLKNGKEPDTHEAPEEHKKKKKKRKHRALDEPPEIAAPTADGDDPPVHKDRGFQDERKKDATQENGLSLSTVPQPQTAVGKGAEAADGKGSVVTKASDKEKGAGEASEKKRKKKAESDGPAKGGGAKPADGGSVLVPLPFGGLGNKPGLQDVLEGKNAFLPLDADVIKGADVDMAAEKGVAVNESFGKGEPPEAFSEKKRKKKRKKHSESESPAEPVGLRAPDPVGAFVRSPLEDAGNRRGLQDGAENGTAFLPLDADVLKGADVDKSADVDMGAHVNEAADVDMGADVDKAVDVNEEAADVNEAAAVDAAPTVPKKDDLFEEYQAWVRAEKRKADAKKKEARKAKAEKDGTARNAGAQVKGGGGGHGPSDELLYRHIDRYLDKKWKGFLEELRILMASGFAERHPSKGGKVRQSKGTAKGRVSRPKGLEKVEGSGAETGATGAASRFPIRSGPLPCCIDGCHLAARFGTKADGHPLVPDTCTRHKSPGMSECKSAFCEVVGCFHKVVYRVPGKFRTRCTRHKEEGMVQK